MDTDGPIVGLVLNSLSTTCNLPSSQVTLGTSLGDIGLDSIGLTALVTRIETVYQCELSMNGIRSLYGAVRVEDLVSAVSAALAAVGKSQPA